ncbi:MarR family winged helix-turn-helix transcriptional regulator [Mesorhizobium xinjiangense]|uniref:MarR family winged helix-turn-helix transcriptional regulator n=1 Tax=Mesorhizobium xinjiangense TaxID=2678685 RepID=UPI0012ECE168|nr:MarR family transcriptional regulator [Mesorhizobium xinjiangense]
MQIKSNQSTDRADSQGSKGGENLQLESWLPYRLFRISARVADVLGAFYGPKFGLSRASWRTMAIVANRPGISVKEICQAGGLDQFSVSRAIRQLVELGLAQRQPGRSDKRYAAIALSDAGWQAFGEISDLSRNIDAELMRSVTPQEREALDAILAKLDDASAGILARGWHGVNEAVGSGGRPV